MIALLAEWKWFLGAGLLLAAVLAINHYGDVRYTAGTAVCMKQDQAAANAAEAATDAANAAAIAKNEGAENAESAELNVIAGLELQPVAAPVIRLCDSPPAPLGGAMPAGPEAPAAGSSSSGPFRDQSQQPRADPDLEPKIRALMREADIMLAQCRELDAAAP